MATRRLVFLHGFTQTHHHWRHGAHRIARRLDPAPSSAFVDLPGHGLATADRADTIDTSAERLTALAGRGTYIGYSMGGRVALAAAASDRDGHIERLVLIGATAGLDAAAARADRRVADEVLARRIVDDGVPPFIDDWLAMPLFDGLPDDADGRLARLANPADGLAHSLRTYGTGEMTPLWDRLGEIEIPVLVLAGERDAKFTELGRRIADGLPDGRLSIVAGAGHAAHTEAPDAVAQIVADWLS